MGTPGDKAEMGKVVKGQFQLDPAKQEIPPTITTTVDSGVPDQATSTTTTTTTEMGVLNRLPRFDTFSILSISPTAPSQGKPELYHPSNLEQAHIEEYFTQSKYYSENLQTLHPSLPSKAQTAKTFPNVGEPGPSGLQQKAKAKSVKRTTKKGQQHQQHEQQKKLHTCPQCQKCFISVEKLSKHQQSHSTTSPFKCEHCKKSFSSKFKLVRHALIHSDRKPFSCTVCERTFHRKDHLKNHIKVHSPSKKIYLCEKSNCKKEYTSLMSYRKHLALHAAEEGSLECQICSHTFETKDQILYHLKIHAGSRTVKNPNEKKFTCDMCDRRFFTKKDVRRHLVVHTGMRDFLCQFCPQRFGRKDHLVRHIKKSHTQPSTTTTTTTATSSKLVDDVKIELPTTDTSIQSEMDVKSEFSESSLSNQEQINSSSLDFALDVGDILEQGSFDELTPFLGVLPSTSAQGELKDLGSAILEDIDENVASTSQLMDQTMHNPTPELLSGSVILNDTHIQRLLQTSEEMIVPLPGFSQTFQSPPPP